MKKTLHICLLLFFLVGCAQGAPALPPAAYPSTAPLATALPGSVTPASPAATATSIPPAASLSTALPGSVTPASPTLTSTLSPTASPTPTLPPSDPPVLGPYLQSPAPGSIWVLWDTSKTTSGWVRYGRAPALDQVALEPQPGLRHAVQLTGLADYTQYAYQVAGDEASHTFRSAAGPGHDSFRFAVLGDTRSNPAVHSAIAARIAAAQPDLVLHTGDLVDDGTSQAEWTAYFKQAAPLLEVAPLYPTLGNHEDQAQPYFEYFRLPGNGLWYAFDYADARFIVLKADSFDPSAFAPGAEQRAWLEQELAGAAGKWIFVSFHVPLHTSFAEDPSEVNLRKQLAPLFEKYKVAAVFNGHIHSYERVLENGVTYIVTGGGGAPLYSLNVREPDQQAAALVYHYLLIDVSGGRLTAQAIDIDGKVIDTFEIAAH